MAAAALENIPIETVQQIASFLNYKDIRDLSSTCRPLRSNLYRLLWSCISVHGVKNMMRPCYHIDQWDMLKHPVYPQCHVLIPRAIMQTLRTMTSLESLHLNVLMLSAQQEAVVLDLLQEKPGFKLQHLTIRVGFKVAESFILKCSHELRSPDTDVSSSVFNGLLYQYPSFLDEENYGMPSLRNISNDFPALKTLIFHETREYNMNSSNADPRHRALKEVCVLVEPPQFYQWKRGQGITVRSFHEMPNPNGFPSGVEE
ncbi:unnamed protein product [Fusarium venenatum]|uniref:F-box domain-containing protein n=1 Tax=Fusarium venenatum TaxID=56646 RepID=A0A2L2T4S8_9HYPO|nr:uncharacterized protein FVRRES_11549 [Fusarium venenatum]CEI38858.1 unnamed protein product [Fusarium venenatum]